MTATAAPVDRPPATDDVYDEVAPYYSSYRRWWTALVGGGVERRLRRALRAALRPGIGVLDAGGGTGAIARAVLQAEPTARVTLLDRSEGMLDEARGLRVRRMRGDIAALPFRDGSFDVVTAAWVLETLPDPARAVRELLRVLAPDGQLLAVFSARPLSTLVALLWRPVERVISADFAGRFLRPGDVPFHRCAASHRNRPRLAPAGYIALGRCCLEALAVADQWGSPSSPRARPR